MAELSNSGSFVKSLIIIGIIIALGFAWFGTRLFRDTSDFSLTATQEEKLPKLKVPDELRASADIDWSLFYGDSDGQRDQVSRAIAEASSKFGVNPDLVRAIIMAESVFDPKAISPKGARGLMQLMPGTAREVGIANPHDPRENIFGGTAYLASLLKEFKGNVRISLAAYNAGPQTLRESHGAIPDDILPYVSRVMSYYRFFGGAGALDQLSLPEEP